METIQHPLSETQFRADIARILCLPTSAIAEDDDLVDHGLDSIRLMMLVDRWRAAGVNIAFVNLAERRTLRAWWRCVSACPALPVEGTGA